MPTQEESTELWKTFMDTCTKDISKFSFWFGLLKTLYLPILFPVITKELGIEPSIDIADSKKFKNCPSPLLEILSSRIAIWMRSEPDSPIFSTICPSENGALMMAICRETCKLPIEYAKTIAATVEIFREFFFVCYFYLDINNIKQLFTL